MRGRLLPFLFLAVLFPGAAPHAVACDYCWLYQGVCPLEGNTFSVRLDARYLTLATLFENGARTTNPYAQRETFFTMQLTGTMLVARRLTVLVSAPLTARAAHADVAAAQAAGVTLDPEADAFGLGDLTLMGRYRVLDLENMTGGWNASAWIAAGVKLPTGSTGARGVDGTFADAHIQPGTGSFDPLVGASFYGGTIDVQLAANALVWFPGPGARGYRFGTIANAEVTATIPVWRAEAPSTTILFAGCGIGGEWHGRETQDGTPDPNTGGQTFFLDPLLRWDTGAISLDASVQVPLLHHLDGTQLGETYRPGLGAQYRW